MAGRFSEFFEGEGRRLSMSRLLCFLSFFPATYILLINITSEKISDLLLWYLGAFVCSYVGGKGADAFSRRKDKPWENFE